MQIHNRSFSGFGVLALSGMLFLSGCATKKWVRQEIAPIGPRITATETSIKENAERIDAVDRRAQQGIAAAAAADTKAAQAGTAAAAAQTAATTAQRGADTANQGVQQATTRIGSLETKVNSLNDNYTVAGEPTSVTFKLGSATLSDDAKKSLDNIAGTVSGQKAGYMLEIQGYTDSTGSENINDSLSQRRAENVLRYLVSKSVPLFRVSIVGLGESNPVADNKTRQGREMNRRVEVRTLRSANAASTN
jgi:outer membrane protein OmpA-like peptidoglycan-associated protein